ncbi:MAG: glycosyltransferase family 39 protein [Anaerolineales bacterium]
MRIAPILAIPLLGVGLVLFHTSLGPGASGDSAFYVMGAKNLLAGNGYSRFSGGYELKPISGFPPGFPVMLAVFSTLIPDMFAAARLMNALLFGVSLFLMFWIVWRATGSRAAGLISQSAILLSPVQFDLHSWVMSEPLYIFLMLLSLVLVESYVRAGRPLLLVGVGILMAAATLTRYVGASLIAAGCFAMVVLGKGSLRRRLVDAGVLGLVSALPVVAWLRRNAAVADTLTNREILYHPMRPELIRQYLAEISSWFVPHAVPLPTLVRAGLAVMIVLGLSAALIYMAVRFRWFTWSPEEKGLQPVHPAAVILPTAVVVSIAFILILVANSLFLDAATTASAPPRYLAPVYVLSVLVFVCAGYWSQRVAKSRVVLSSMLLVLAVSLGVQGVGTIDLLRNPLPSLGYMGRRYTWAQTTDALRAIESGVPIVSNNPEMVYILSERPAFVRPIRFDVYQQRERDDYLQQVEATRDKLEAGGVYVILDEIEAVDQDILERTGAELLARYPHASFYGYQRGAEGRE